MTGERPVALVRALSKEDRDEIRRLSVMHFLWNVLNHFRENTDPAGWLQHGLNVEEFLECLESGRPHPVLDAWEKLKSGPAANRPAPSSRELGARRFAVLACEALDRRNVGPDQARRLVAKELARAKVFANSPSKNAPSANAIHHWQKAQPPLTAADETVIANAQRAAGASDSDLVKYFVGLIGITRDPAPRLKPVP
jgi:hypothetical protein